MSRIEKMKGLLQNKGETIRKQRRTHQKNGGAHENKDLPWKANGNPPKMHSARTALD